jgi:hypothetical protein
MDIAREGGLGGPWYTVFCKVPGGNLAGVCHGFFKKFLEFYFIVPRY